MPDAEKRFREVIEHLERLPQRCADDATLHRARVALKDLIGPVEVAEEGEGVFAYVPMGVLY